MMKLFTVFSFFFINKEGKALQFCAFYHSLRTRASKSSRVSPQVTMLICNIVMPRTPYAKWTRWWISPRLAPLCPEHPTLPEGVGSVVQALPLLAGAWRRKPDVSVTCSPSTGRTAEASGNHGALVGGRPSFEAMRNREGLDEAGVAPGAARRKPGAPWAPRPFALGEGHPVCVPFALSAT